MRLAADYQNNFDLLRMIAATMVVFYHSYAVLGVFSLEPILGFMWGDGVHGLSANNLGVVGVHIFFVISGYLVTASFLRNEERYFQRRFARIMPGLIGAILFCAFIVGPLVTALPLPEYFASGSFYHFLSYGFVVPIEPNFIIADVFADLTVPAMNVSLWTIPWEVTCYLLLPLILTSPLRYNRTHLVCALIAGILIYVRMDGLSFNKGLLCSIYFLMGSVLYRARDVVVLKPRYCWAAIFAIFIGYATGIYDYISVIALPYLVIYFACYDAHYVDFMQTLKGDYSYGIYVYSWPVQQSLVWLSGGEMAPHFLFLASFALSLLLAVFSWHIIEKPYLKRRST